MNQTGEGGDEAPTDKNASDPFAGAPNFGENPARNFQQAVAGKENARAKSEYGVGEAQILGHLKAS